MREISSRIPNGVRRMTDGETGDRNYWISFQTQKFEQMPEFETVSVGQAYETAAGCPGHASASPHRGRLGRDDQLAQPRLCR